MALSFFEIGDTLIHTFGILHQPQDLFEQLSLQYKDDLQLYRGPGYHNCNDSGYRGRAGIHELLVVSEEIKELIQNRVHIEEIRRAAVNQGMRTLKQDVILKVFHGLTDSSQARRVCIV